MEEIKNMRLVQIDDETHCRFIEYVPSEELDESKQIYITDEDRLAIGETKCFDLENNCVVDYDNTEDLKKAQIEELRAKREPLLKAFDTYKINIVYGLVEETEKERNDIVAWYKRLLDLNEEAIENVPSKISYYL